MGETEQARRWAGEFGERYVERHPTTVEGFDELRECEQYGVTQTELLRRYLGELDRDIRILEVGTNIGLQLRCLRELGFTRLYGVDVSKYALDICREAAPELHLVRGDALDLPFEDDHFDLVFTNEVLATIPPANVETAIGEIVRCSRRWVWGLEHYADEYTEIEYRGEDEMLWKTDFPSLYTDLYELRLRKQEYLELLDQNNQDVVFLFEIPPDAR